MIQWGDFVTDFEKMKNMLVEMGIGFDITAREGKTIIFLKANRHKNVGGYGGFVAEFLFDENEKSMGAAIWE